MRYKFYIALGLIIFNVIPSLNGQRQRPDVFEGGEVGETIDSLQERAEIELPDTAIIDFYHFDRIHFRKPDVDSVLQQKSQLYDPSRLVEPLHAQLGNLGSAAMPLAYSKKKEIGFRLGYDQYDIYQIQKDSFKLYQVNRPVTSIFFIPGSGQQNFFIKTKFARNFAHNINVSLDYQRIKQEGSYSTQNTKSTYIGAALWYKAPSKKYDLILSVISNSNNEVNNGGITSKSLFEEPFYNFRERIPVQLSDAETRLTYRQYNIDNYWHLVQQEGRPWKFSIRHEFSYIREGYKSFDEVVDTDLDSSFYNQLWTDTRGLRNRMSYNNLRQGVYLILDKGKGFNAQTGLQYGNYDVSLDGSSFSKNSLQLHFNGFWSFKETLSLNARAKVSLLDYIGDLDLDAEIALKTGKIGILKGGFHFNRSSPSAIHNELYISQSLVWKNNYTRPIYSSLFGEYQLPGLGLSVRITQSFIENPLFFNLNASSAQYDGALSITEIKIQENLSIGPINLDNQFQYQYLDQELYPLPDWFSAHSLYLHTRIFNRKMQLKTGFDIRLIEEYPLPAYMPLLGQFYIQEQEQEPLFFLTDFFINFKISSFRAFLRLENVTDFLGDRIFYQVQNYPQFDFKIKLGIHWSLFD